LGIDWRYLNRRPTGHSVRTGAGAAMVIQGVRQPSTGDSNININGHFVELEINIFLMTSKPFCYTFILNKNYQ